MLSRSVTELALYVNGEPIYAHLCLYVHLTRELRREIRPQMFHGKIHVSVKYVRIERDFSRRIRSIIRSQYYPADVTLQIGLVSRQARILDASTCAWILDIDFLTLNPALPFALYQYSIEASSIFLFLSRSPPFPAPFCPVFVVPLEESSYYPRAFPNNARAPPFS